MLGSTLCWLAGRASRARLPGLQAGISTPNGFAKSRGLKYTTTIFPTRVLMPKKIRVEADICAPKPVPPNGYTITTGHGQKISLERGSHTRSKKNPGKRPSKGG